MEQMEKADDNCRLRELTLMLYFYLWEREHNNQYLDRANIMPLPLSSNSKVTFITRTSIQASFQSYQLSANPIR